MGIEPKLSFLGKIIAAVIVPLAMTSCLAPKETTSTSSSTTSWFDGITTVQNMGGYPSAIKVTWAAAPKPVTKYRIYSLLYSVAAGGNTWQMIDEVDGNTFSMINSDLSSGQIYSYMVRAVDEEGEEDTNGKQLSTVAFDGIISAIATGTSTATVGINTGTGSFDEIRVYAQPSNGGSKKLVATARGQVNVIDVTGLRSGVKYKFSAQAYMSYLGAEDGNEAYSEAQTKSESFGSGATNDSTYTYRGVIAVQSVGDAPNAPAAPTARQVSLTWLPFSNANGNTRYRVVRATTSFNVNTATTTACTSATTNSCIVTCTNTGMGTQTCVDTNVAPPPMAYNYVITQVKTDSSTGETWAEELPTTNASDFYVKVHIPSAYMVLIQRDAANYDMCRILNSTSNPRKFQRCSYTGIAATPYNTGPGKIAKTYDNGFYDFGYNLFVDRFRTGCNWTRTSTSCGPNGCIGTPVVGGSGTPSGIGSDGDVYFALNGSYGANCYYKQGTTWVNVNTLTDPVQIRRAITIDPGPNGQKHIPSLGTTSGQAGFNICSAQQSDYGNKRLMRRREHVHAAAFATIPGEPNAITDKIEEYNLRVGAYNSTLNIGGQLSSYQRCQSSSAANLLAAPSSINDLLDASNTRSQIAYVGSNPQWYNWRSSSYFIGTSSTAKCVSRWGAQDPVSRSNADHNTPLSDSFLRVSDLTVFPAQFMPVVSDWDSGVVYDWVGYGFDGIVGPALGTSLNGYFANNLNASAATTYPRFIAPLGVPLITNSPIYPSLLDLAYNGVLGPNSYGTGNNANNYHIYDTGSMRFTMVEGQQHRFSYTLHQEQNTSEIGGPWCALEAE